MLHVVALEVVQFNVLISPAVMLSGAAEKEFIVGSWLTVTITCAAQGYRSEAHRLITTIDNSVASNLLFGSSIGMAVDIMSGAAEQYPSRILIHLEPQTFPNIAARDAWFGRFRDSLAGKWNGIVNNLRISCEEDLDGPMTCRDELAQARADRGVALEALDRRRDRAVIRAESQARTQARQP